MSDSADPGETPGNAVRGRQNVLALHVPPRMTAIVDESEDPLPVELMAAVNTREGYTPTLVATVFGYEGGQPLFTRSALEGLERDLVFPHIIGVADWEPPWRYGTSRGFRPRRVAVLVAHQYLGGRAVPG